ncbi:MAG: flavoprotein [Thermoplasmata archaeon]
MRIAWAITGAGHFLNESFQIMDTLKKNNEITLFVSSAGEEVISVYNLKHYLTGYQAICEKDQGPSFSVCGRFMRGEYDLLIISPATSNTVAKMAFGIADTMITAIFSHATKVRIPVLVVPTDIKSTKTITPDGEKIMVYARKIDTENIQKLSQVEGVTIVKNPNEILKYVDGMESQK